jgi:peroxin-19
MMLSGEGMEALGLDGKKGASPGPSTRAGGAAPAAGGPAGKASFDDTIRRTMESLNAGGAGASNDGMPEDLAALLAQLSKDPSALDGLGEDDDELGGLLDSMMGQLMSKDVLEEPMTELAAKVS